jgi:hypothetical protein
VNIDLKNAYRVLLTRARQGMVIFVPPGANRDKTRSPGFYEGVSQYLTDWVCPRCSRSAAVLAPKVISIGRP